MGAWGRGGLDSSKKCVCLQKESTLTARAAFFDLMPPQSLLQPPITPAFKISFCERSEAYEHVERLRGWGQRRG